MTTDYRAIQEARDAAQMRGRASALLLIAALPHELAKLPEFAVEGWGLEARTAKDSPDRERLPALVHTTGARVHLRQDWQHPDRVEVYGDYPSYVLGGQITRRDAEGPEPITFAATRLPAAAARDLARRFLVPYLAAYARALTLVRLDRERVESAERAAGELCQALGIPQPREHASQRPATMIRLPAGFDAGGSFDVQTGGERVYCPHLSLSLDAAKHLAAYLRLEQP
jgi:hypothetical protein